MPTDDADTVIVSTRLAPDEVARLDAIAQREDRHRSQQIANFIRRCMRDAEAQESHAEARVAARSSVP